VLRNAFSLSENPEGREHLQDLGVDGKIIGKYGIMVGTGFIWLSRGTSGGHIVMQQTTRPKLWKFDDFDDTFGSCN
jgi:hypothetical protein